MPRSYCSDDYTRGAELVDEIDRRLDKDAEREPLAVIKRVTDPQADRDEKNRRRFAAAFVATRDESEDGLDEPGWIAAMEGE